MKTLVVYYSRTNTTKKVSEKIAELAKCDIEELIDTKDRTGAKGYIIAGKDALTKQLTILEPVTKNASQYDLIILSTPVWAYTMCPAIRTYIEQNKDDFKSVAFLCTMGGSGDKSTFEAMTEICYKNPRATLALKTKEIMQDEYKEKLKEFLKQLQLI
ncbi:MAG: flavodoxin [archaeon]